MIVLNDLCGDEDDTFLVCEMFKVLLQNAAYEALLKVNPKDSGWATFRYPGTISYVSLTCEVV